MNRHFTKEMAYKVQKGLKTKTTRYKAWKIQEVSKVVFGSRYKPIKFGTIKVKSAILTTWRASCASNFREEGFSSEEDMVAFIFKHKLVKGTLDDEVWVMEFEYHKEAGDAEVVYMIRCKHCKKEIYQSKDGEWYHSEDDYSICYANRAINPARFFDKAEPEKRLKEASAQSKLVPE